MICGKLGNYTTLIFLHQIMCMYVYLYTLLYGTCNCAAMCMHYMKVLPVFLELCVANAYITRAIAVCSHSNEK